MEISVTLSFHYIPPRISPSCSSISSSNTLFFNGGGGRTDLLSKKKNRLVLNRSKDQRQRSLNCRCMFGLGVPEIAVIVGVATLLFGPKKLPEIGRSVGQTFKSFQLAAKEFESELKKEAEPEPEPEPEPKLEPVVQPTVEKTTVDSEEKKQGVQV